AGLITGGDIIEQAGAVRPGELLLLPSVMLKKDEGVFLDDVTLGQLERNLGVRTVVVDGPRRLVETTCGENR
ncbi:MAG: DUF512 domain-containing protein, partial [Firmicutes bacterium]|nr:DUF512 domain-containing protein [Bacillota bacterium]